MAIASREPAPIDIFSGRQNAFGNDALRLVRIFGQDGDEDVLDLANGAGSLSTTFMLMLRRTSNSSVVLAPFPEIVLRLPPQHESL